MGFLTHSLPPPKFYIRNIEKSAGRVKPLLGKFRANVVFVRVVRSEPHLPRGRAGTEEFFGLGERGDEHIDFFAGIIEVETGARRRA